MKVFKVLKIFKMYVIVSFYLEYCIFSLMYPLRPVICCNCYIQKVPIGAHTFLPSELAW
jgi:hypothetical protein